MISRVSNLRILGLAAGRLCVLAGVHWLALISVAACCQASEPPNILILMADNWAWPHAGALGDKVVQTPTFDRLAQQGVLFDHAFCLVPSCSPARATFLTGQAAHRLQDAASLHGLFPAEHIVFTDILEQAGYRVGYAGKGWGPGKWRESGRHRNPAGESFASFEAFLEQQPAQKPFCFWFSSRNPHIPWDVGQDRKAHMSRADARVPSYLPDTPVVRENILDYYAEVESFDEECRQHMNWLEDAGRAGNTLVVICGDNGWQMPHGLAHCYDAGTRIPMLFHFPKRLARGVRCSELINFDDMAPTLLELSGVQVDPAILAKMTGRSLRPLLLEQSGWDRQAIFIERERHANVRQGNAAYPVRGVRTKDFLYLRNFEPERWPAGDPELWFAVGPFGDTDFTATKQLIVQGQQQPELAKFFEINFGRRPAEELYDLRIDPDQIHNVVTDPKYATDRSRLAGVLQLWMTTTEDPRAHQPSTTRWDTAPYFGAAAK